MDSLTIPVWLHLANLFSLVPFDWSIYSLTNDYVTHSMTDKMVLRLISWCWFSKWNKFCERPLKNHDMN